METVNVTLEGVQGEPLGHVDTRVMDVTVTASYTSAVVLADGTIIPPVIAEKILGSNGKTSFTVYGSDSTEVNELYRGFGVRFTAKVRYARGQAGPTYQRTVKVPAGGPHNLGSLPAAEPLPPEFASVADVIGDFDARLDALEDHPVNHAARHAAGGPDPITPAAIGALTAAPGYWSGHLDDAPAGTFRTGASVTGIPPSPNGVGFVTTYHPVTGATHAVQWFVSHPDAYTFVRTRSGGGVWGAWVMIPADTGARVLTPENGWTGRITVQRIGANVFLDVTAANGTNATSDTLVTLPAGFRPQGFKGLFATPGTPVGGTDTYVCQLQTGGVLRCPTGRINTFINADWPTRDDLPATLPGTPA